MLVCIFAAYVADVSYLSCTWSERWKVAVSVQFVQCSSWGFKPKGLKLQCCAAQRHVTIKMRSKLIQAHSGRMRECVCISCVCITIDKNDMFGQNS